MYITDSDLIKAQIETGAGQRMTDREFVSYEIQRWLTSPERKAQIDGDNYFRGYHDIRNKVRMTIGEGGVPAEVDNIPNNRITDNQYRKMVQQKRNYLLGKPFTIKTDDSTYADLLNTVFDARFMRQIKNLGGDSLNCGIAWMYVYYDDAGELSFKTFPAWQILPFWSDEEHTHLDGAVRYYNVTSYSGIVEQTIHKVEIYSTDGIDYFEYYNGALVPSEPYHADYMQVDDMPFNWSKIPLVAFKANDEERPLITGVKSLQDGLNRIESQFEDAIEEDPRNSIMVLVNYDGENLGEFRRNLATYGAVKVRSNDGVSGDVKTLNVQVNAENYNSIIKVFKSAIVENCMGYDAKDDRMSGNPNEMNIRSMYSDIDLDANDMELEYKASLTELLWFVDAYFSQTGKGDFRDIPVEFQFNRDIMVNDSEQIANVKNSIGIVSTETALAHHPYVQDVAAEMEKIDAEKQKNIEEYGLPINAPEGSGGDSEGSEGEGDE